MNHIKLQQDIIKNHQKEAHRQRASALSDDYIALTPDSESAYIIRKEDCILDITKLRDYDFAALFKESELADPIQYVQTVKFESSTTGCLVEFRGADGEPHYYDEKKLKYIGGRGINFITYKRYKTRLFIWEDEQLVGVVLERRIR